MTTATARERPILFQTDMVRAILAGRKTQTRRIVRSPSHRHPEFALADHGNGWVPYLSDDGESTITDDGNETPFDCPYGGAGDRLWVRETFAIADNGHEEWPVYLADGASLSTLPATRGPSRWQSRIFMPRWASRITLEITSVRIEQVQEISESAAIAEGSPRASGSYSHRSWYRKVWDQTNGAGSWDANPWVWVIQFRGSQELSDV